MAKQNFLVDIDLNGNSVTSPLYIGGTAVGSFSTYKSTTGIGTPTGVAHRFVGGNNGATQIADLYNDGSVNIGNKVNTTQRLVRLGQDTAFIDFGSRVGSTANAAIYFNQLAPSSSNYTLQGSATNTNLNANSTISTNGVFISIGNVARAQFSDGALTLTPGVTTAGIGPVFSFTSPANTAQTSGSEAILVDWNLSATMQHAGSVLLALQRGFNITAPTFSYASAGGIITNAPTFNITGAASGGANTTIVNSHGALIQSNVIANVTNGYGLSVNAPSGATNNYAAQFIGKVGFNVSDPTAFGDFDASVAANASLRIRAGTSPSTPKDCDIINSSTNKSIDAFVAGIWQHTPGVIFTQIADKTIANTTTATSLFGTGRTGDTKTLSANFWTIGKSIKVTLKGYAGTTGTPNITGELRLGSTAIITTPTTGVNSTLTSPEYFEIELIMTCRTVGATGTVMAQGRFSYHDGTINTNALETIEFGPNTTTTTIDTTASAILDLFWTWGTANAANSITSTNSTIEILN